MHTYILTTTTWNSQLVNFDCATTCETESHIIFTTSLQDGNVVWIRIWLGSFSHRGLKTIYMDPRKNDDRVRQSNHIVPHCCHRARWSLVLNIFEKTYSEVEEFFFVMFVRFFPLCFKFKGVWHARIYHRYIRNNSINKMYQTVFVFWKRLLCLGVKTLVKTE